jgi:hypothetical protein
MKIFGYNYTVHRDGNYDKIGAMVRFLVDTQEIQIASNLTEQQAISTLLHEVIEAISYHCQLELPHPAMMTLETGLYQFLVDNGVDLSPLLEAINERKEGAR